MNDQHPMTYAEWLAFREKLFQECPVHPRHLRLDIELAHPRTRLRDVPVEFNPHSTSVFHAEKTRVLFPHFWEPVKYDAYETFYVCDDWTTISPVVHIKDSPHPQPTLRFITESGHQEGDRIRLMSTSCTIVHEWWAARKNWNDFAVFRGQFWRVTWNEYFGEWPGGKWFGLPFQDRRHYNDPQPDQIVEGKNEN